MMTMIEQTVALSLLTHRMEQLLESDVSVPLMWKSDWKQLITNNMVPLNVYQAVLEQMCRSLAAEHSISEILQNQRIVGTRYIHLEHRVKSPLSIATKVLHRLQRRGLEPTLANARLLVEELDDIVRYSCVISSDDAFLSTMEVSAQSLVDAGNVCRKIKSAFQIGGSYRGVLTTWSTAWGETFELQYHTEDSIALNDKAHALYDMMRDTTENIAVRQGAVAACVKLFSAVPIPPGVENLTTMVGVQVQPYKGLSISK